MSDQTPLRLNQSYVKAKAAVGLPNPSQEIELLDPVASPTLEIGSVRHLAPVAFSPRYMWRVFETGTPTNRQTFEIQPSPIPYSIVSVDPLGNNIEFTATKTTIGGLALWTQERGWFPTQDLAPKTLVVFQGDIVTAIDGCLMEANRIWQTDMLIEPGTFVQLQAAGAAQAIDTLVLIQEYPGGAVPVG